MTKNKPWITTDITNIKPKVDNVLFPLYSQVKRDVRQEYYEFINGETFSTKEELLKYIDSLPRIYVFTLKYQANKEHEKDHSEIGLWEIGYETTETYTETVDVSYGGFGMEYSYEDSFRDETETVEYERSISHRAGLFQGSYGDAVAHACTIDKWFKASRQWVVKLDVTIGKSGVNT